MIDLENRFTGSTFSLIQQMADFSSAVKKIVPTTGETKVLLGWGLATALMFALQYVVFAFVSGSGVSSRRLPVMRVLVLGGVAYAVLMMRDLVAYYAGVGVDEMFSMSPVVVFGVLFFMSVFLIYGIHDIQDIGSAVATSSQKTGGNLLSFFFETENENFEEIDETEATHNPNRQASPSPLIQPQRPLPPMASGDSMGVSQYGAGSDPFANPGASAAAGGSHSLPQNTRDTNMNKTMYDQRGGVSMGAGAQQVQQPLMAAGGMMGGGLSGGSSFAAF